MTSLARTGGTLALLLAMTGCTAAGAIVAEQAADSMDSVESEIVWIAHSIDGMTASTTPEDAANASAANAAAFWTDGCFSYSIDGGSITYTLDDCGGPFELAGVTGSVTVTYRESGASYGFDIVATDLMVHASTVSFMVSGDVSTDGRNVNVTTSGSATGRRNHMISHTGTYSLQWNGSSECAGIDSGTWNTTVDGETFTTTVTNWRRCGATGCPAAGGSIGFSGPRSFITLMYDGTPEASWTSGAGGSGTIRLFCTEP